MSKSSYFAGWLIDGTGTPAQQDILICVENGLILSLEKANPAECNRAGLTVETDSPPFSKGGRPHKRSGANLKYLTSVGSVSANPNEVRVRPHKRSDANLKRLASVGSVSANPNEVRVRPHKRSDANLKRLASVGNVNANPSEVRVQGGFYPACTILPGLIDCHVHLSMSGKIDQNLRFRQLLNDFAQNSPLICERIEKSLASGIMALRDGGDIGGHTLTYIRQNGPSHVRVKCPGKAWRAPGRYGKIIGRIPEDGSTLAESIKANREVVDHIKIINSGLNSLSEFGRETLPQFNRDELEAAFQNARKLGQKVMVHANGKLPVQFAVEAGCDSIEHGFFMGEDNMKRMADRQVFWVPTAVTMKAMRAHMPAGNEAAKDSQVASRMLEAQLEQMGRARELGVRLAAGTDAGSFGVRHGVALAEELKLIIEAGFSVEEAIGCATSAGARLLGLDHELGRLAPGMPANFIIVPGPPSSLPDSLADVKAVCVNGKRIIISGETVSG
ncbi:MAG: amidohydrolase family protein [Syntrophobacteraceae bacterium]|jgi:imidazolonepropionase-like amidohydrolase